MSGSPDGTPTADDLTAYLAGTLPGERFAAVDAWLAGLPDERAARLLEEAGARCKPLRLDVVAPAPEEPGFAAERARLRLDPSGAIGEGGMAVVRRALDRALEREVALKVLRPRGADESLEQYSLRAHAFRREAALTAALEHPAIPPVHDIGQVGGRPAFTMQRLAGGTLAERLRDEPPPALHLIETLLRAAEAIAFAHSRGIVHRDLAPANILVGDFGAVHVVDWGAAERIGAGGGLCIGTPGWMAPEQAAGAPADPRMDVFALGALLHLLLTGRGPRPDPAHPGRPDLAGLAARGIPRGLAAVARRCLDEPGRRYGDAGAVVAELRRWLDDGITLAQEAGRLERAWLGLRRSPQARRAAAAALLIVLAAGSAWWLHRRDARRMAIERIGRIAGAVDLRHPEAVRLALAETEAVGAAHPALPEVRALSERLRAASEVLAQHERLAAVQDRFRRLLDHIRRTGPWPGELREWSAALAEVGIDMADGRPPPAWRDHPLALGIAESLVWAWRAAAERGGAGTAARAAAILADGGPTPGWRALGRACSRSRFLAHDPVLPEGADAEAALAEFDSAAVTMAVFAPVAAINARAGEVLRDRPGDFWPLIAAARAALAAGDLAAAERLGLVASGAEPASMYPPLILAYAALARDDGDGLARAVGRGLRINPDHSELLALQAVALARGGRSAAAQDLVDRIGAGHLQYHLQHRVGHPMERTVDALLATGLRIGAAAPDLGPLVPDHRHQHQAGD